ncbi:hypothetical protein GOODEAATRI_002598 [Goodea atripinnis]|uniref:Uncharacterized protein n=1 Tax=Goodea atripinnis TaxID=208336 RepID=A0ABV0MNS4_9TELE
MQISDQPRFHPNKRAPGSDYRAAPMRKHIAPPCRRIGVRTAGLVWRLSPVPTRERSRPVLLVASCCFITSNALRLKNNNKERPPACRKGKNVRISPSDGSLLTDKTHPAAFPGPFSFFYSTPSTSVTLTVRAHLSICNSNYCKEAWLSFFLSRVEERCVPDVRV